MPATDQPSGASVRAETLAWLWQRISAAVLGVCVFIHLGTIIYAIQNGLTAEEIVSRVAGNEAWLVFYSVFVLAVAVHAPIGLRTILREVTGLSRGAVGVIMIGAVLLILGLGFRAVFGLYGLQA